MDRDQFVALLREHQRQIAATDHLINQMQYNEVIGYTQADERRLNALGDLLFAANESLIGEYYKIKDNAPS